MPEKRKLRKSKAAMKKVVKQLKQDARNASEKNRTTYEVFGRK